MSLANDAILEVRDLKTYFPTRTGIVRAVDGVSFELKRRQTLCVVGESGSGKSVTARSILQIVDRPGRSTIRRIERAVTLLPQPLSPPIPSVLPGQTSKLAPSTALTTPSFWKK